jgi:hypothetical protein
MSKQLQMSDAAWMSLQKMLAPTTTPTGKCTNWKHFLNKCNPNLNLEILGEERVPLLHENHENFLNLFKVLNVDGTGSIDHHVFVSDSEMLNKT